MIWDDTRADWNARPGKSMFTASAAERTALMIHNSGGHALGLANKSHSACLAQVSAWQSFHMGPQRGWADLGYNGLICQHGRSIEGRGLDKVGAHCPGYNRTGYGIQFMVGGNEEPTQAAKARMLQMRSDLRARSGRLQDLGHRNGIATECPGDLIMAWIRNKMPISGGAQSSPAPAPVPSRPSDGKLVVDGVRGPATNRALQKLVNVTVDGLWGPATRRGLQAYLRVAVDGDFGVRSVKALQKWSGAKVDGIWGVETTKAVQRTLNGKPKRPGAPSKSSGTKVPPFPLRAGHWYGPESKDARNHSGYWKIDQDKIRTIQMRLRGRGWRIEVTGRYDQRTASVIQAFQREKGLKADGLVGRQTWLALWKEPVT